MLSRNARWHLWNGLIVATVFLLAIAVSVLPLPLRAGMIVENGPIEAFSAYGYFVCVVILLLRGRDLAARGSIIVLLVALGVRELGLHNLLTTTSITRTRFYVDPDVPIWEKAAAVIVLAAIVVAVLRLLGIQGRSFLRALLRRDPAAIAVLCGFTFIGISKSIDGMSRKLASIGIDYSDDDLEVVTVFEETLELGIPAMFLAASLAWIGRSSPGATTGPLAEQGDADSSSAGNAD